MKTVSEAKPVSPQEILDDLENIIPAEVVEAFNNLLKKNYRGGKHSVGIKQEDVLNEISRLDPHVSREDLFDNHWMDIEPLFKEHGWKVKYESPCIGDNFAAYWEFTPNPK
jgi:hypothetical protein